MKKLIVLCLCLVFLAGCISVPAYAPQTVEETAAAASATAEPVPAKTAAAEPVPAKTDTAAPEPTARPVPGVTREPVPAATFTAGPTAAPTPTAPPDQTYTGTYFRFNAPGSWLRADISSGVYFYPDQKDTQHAYLLYQETANEMRLTESSLDIALLFSSKETITAMVEGALTSSGITGFTLSPVDIEKTKLNGFTCYRGASTVTLEGESYDFVGHIFLQGEKMVLLIWVGDQAAYADALAAVYDSFAAVR